MSNASERARILLFQCEMERGGSPLVRIPPRGRGFFKTSGSTDPMWSLEEHGVEASIAITWDQQKAMNVAGPFFYAVACYLTGIVDAEAKNQLQRGVAWNEAVEI
jgi:hypothetical protein